MNLSNYDSSMQSLRVNGQYLVETTAGNIHYSDEGTKRHSIQVFNYGTDSKVKTFLIQANGHIMVNASVSTFRALHLGHFNEYKFERLS